MRAQLERTDLAPGGPLPLPLRARQGARGRAASTPTSFAPLRRGQPAAQGSGAATTATTITEQRAPLDARCSRPSSSPRARDWAATAPRSDLRRRPAARRFDAGRADPVEPFGDRGHDGTARHRRHRQGAERPQRGARRVSKYPEVLADARRRRAARARRALPAADPHPAQDRRALLHRQDAEQLGARRADPPDAAEREDHRRAPPSAELLLLGLQAALRARPELQLFARGHRPLLRRLRRR